MRNADELDFGMRNAECGMRNAEFGLGSRLRQGYGVAAGTAVKAVSDFGCNGRKEAGRLSIRQVSWARKRVAAAVMLYASQVASRRAYAVCRDPNLDAAEDETGSIIFKGSGGQHLIEPVVTYG
jgi:hypothetical protein